MRKEKFSGGDVLVFCGDLTNRGELLQLLMWFWFNLVIGNNDCHSKNLAMLAQEVGISDHAIKNPVNKLFKELDKLLETNVQEFESRFTDVKTARIIEKEIKKRMRYFREKFSLE